MVKASDMLNGDINTFLSSAALLDKSLKILKPNWFDEFNMASCDFVKFEELFFASSEVVFLHEAKTKHKAIISAIE
jgi:hypothetical protein